MVKVHIKENSFLARIASFKFQNRPTAIVFGNTVHLYKTNAKDFVKNTSWLKHELKHIYQFKQYGIIRFVCLYIWESIRNGYTNNKFEVEARDAENKAMPQWIWG